MPALKNPRREAFAQAIARGLSTRAAYVAAGYIDHMSNAATLRRNSNIEARLRELRPDLPVVIDAAPAATWSSVIAQGLRVIDDPDIAADSTATVESLMRELEQARALAMAEGQTRAAISATMEKARLQGLGDTRAPQGATDNPFQIFDLSHLTDAQLATLEAIFGPLAAAGSGDGDDRDGEGEES